MLSGETHHFHLRSHDVHPLLAGSSAYNAELSLAGQSMKMEATNTVTDQGDSWLVTETAIYLALVLVRDPAAVRGLDV